MESYENAVYRPFDDEEFRQMPSAEGIRMYDLQHYLLGSNSAQTEWQNPDKARSTFIHLSSYEHFIDKNQLILLGRTGSGKSAIICSLKDDIEKGKVSEYTDVIQIDEADFCIKLAELCYDVDITHFEAASKVTQAIMMTMYTTVMLYCFSNYKDKLAEGGSIIQYLSSQGFVRSPVSGMRDVLNELTSEGFERDLSNLISSNNGKALISVSRIFSHIYNAIKNSNNEPEAIHDDYTTALSELSTLLIDNKKYFLLLLDSFDEYRVNDSAFVVGIKSLILAAFTMFNNSIRTPVLLKIAMASEVYTRVLTNLPAKNHSNTVVITWTYKELMKCMAISFLSWYNSGDCYSNKKVLFSFLDKYKLSDLKNPNTAYKTVENIFNNILPDICSTNSSYTYITLAYITRHTMKRPREILQVFNAILDCIICNNDTKYFLDNGKSGRIKDLVHSLQDDFIRQNLSIYRIFIPNIDNYVDTLLRGKKFIFSLSEDEFEKKLKEVNAQVQEDVTTTSSEYLSHLTRIDILSIVFETGLLGKVQRVRQIDAQNIEQFNAERPLNIIDAIFEYQFKGNIKKSSQSQYVIHPMCYEHFNCFVGMRSMVNTDSFDKTELLCSVIPE